MAAPEEAAAHSPYINKPDSPEFLMMHHRIVAKLMGFITPDSALQHFAEADGCSDGERCHRRSDLPNHGA